MITTLIVPYQHDFSNFSTQVVPSVLWACATYAILADTHWDGESCSKTPWGIWLVLTAIATSFFAYWTVTS